MPVLASQATGVRHSSGEGRTHARHAEVPPGDQAPAAHLVQLGPGA